MKRDLRFHRDFPHPRELVWEAITDPQAIAEWLMENDFKPVVGHQFQLRSSPQPGYDGVTRCEVLEVEAPEILAYTFVGGGLDTVVRYRLEEIEGGTRMHVEHTGFSGLRAVLVSFLLQRGIRTIYGKKLPEVLRRRSDSSV